MTITGGEDTKNPTNHEHSTWEFLPGYILDFPVYCIWLFFACKARHLLFFSNVNPGLVFSGFVEESKYKTLMQFPPHYIPSTCLIPAGSTQDQIKVLMQEHGLSYPLIAKPNTAGRNGKGVEKVTSDEECIAYLAAHTGDVLLQEYREETCEFGVYYYRLPSESTGHVTGIVRKEFLCVLGDGTHSLADLVNAHPRAKRYTSFFQKIHEGIWHEPVARDDIITLSYIGNHCRGSVFYDASEHITPELVATFDAMSKHVDVYYCGRYDVKAASIEALQRGEFSILELNGVISEPTWIYDPQHTRRYAIKEMWRHRQIMYRISKENSARGVKPLSLREAWKLIQQYGV